jgi:uncharacterized protein YndB with AHSA1/START domain
MGPVSATITIDAPREQVFAVVADLANRPAFCDHFMTRFHLERLESRGPGAAARFHVAARGFHMWMDTVIAEVEAPYRLLERGHGGHANRMALGTAWELVESAASTTEVTVSFWTEPSNPLDAVRGRVGAGRWHRRQWKRALRRLRDLIESGDEVVPVRVAGASRV